ncbi:uncharacterized protein LOC112574596 isoform X2 [Pomacea canaliculata]|nr:uncharacterized protein LOC112574596 isoform X2 [Pomacea canaliculata]XP_025111568.1 uncharacterized protein LOC112574596 isoform X2 [Pomacea canaliculata]XP_025111569.1 uncharacterized protein LOC112574596 isoform X2 [Pomacea canaliculata]XP_025111570.1 uncharacterized protein LOC112574596 isoform X2 [Pomacea canaliculata]
MPTRTEDYVERNEHEYCEGESQQHFRMNRVDFESASTCWKEEHNMIEQVCAENQLSSDENAHTEETRQTTPQKAPVPLSSAAQSPSTSSSPSASTTQSQYSDFCDRRSSCKKRKRTAAEPPQWFLEYAIIQRKNMKSLLKKEFQERNLLLKQRNNLLNDRNRILNDQINILKERNELLKSYIQQRLQPRPGSLK